MTDTSQPHARPARPGPAGGGWRRIGLVAGLGVVGIIGPLATRACVEGRAELERAELATTTDQQLVHLGRAARWRLPVASHDEQARESIENIATQAELTGDRETSLAAWRELRGSLLGTRAWSIADPAQLARANEGIVRGMIASAQADGEPEFGERWAAELEAAPATDSRETRLAALCFVGWGISVVGFALRAIDPKGKLKPRQALGWGGASAVLLLAWIILM